MGRKAGEAACYYWWSKSKKKRIGWVFGSRKNAERWRNNTYYAYHEYKMLESFLNANLQSSREKYRQLWIRHRDGYLDLEMKKGRIIYDI